MRFIDMWARVAAHRYSRRVIGAGVVLALGLCGVSCTSLGPRQIPVDRFDYNAAIANSANEQMLINLVRLRYGEVPTFLAVNSVLTQYTWTGEAGVAGSGGESLNFPAWSVGGSVNARYIERPTVTYSPLSGREFASQLINPVRADVVFSLVSSGWPPDQLLLITIQRINDVTNAGFVPTIDAPRPSPTKFDRVIGLIVELAKRSAIELVRSPSAEPEDNYLEFTTTPDEPTAALISELKGMIGLDPARHRFHVTRKIVGRGPDEVTIRMHSLLELMGLLAAGVGEPPQASGEVAAPRAEGAGQGVGPLLVQCSRDRPVNPLVAVQYAGNWYCIPRDDESSKRAFGLLIYLFQMQASQNQGAGPLLTVPIG